MSDSGSDKGWTFVNENSDVERQSDDSSTSSSDFVHLENDDVVSYHHKDHNPSVESDSLENVTHSSNSLDGTAVSTGLAPAVADDPEELVRSASACDQEELVSEPCNELEADAGDPEEVLRGCSDPEMVDSAASELQCSDNSDPEMVDSAASELQCSDNSDPEMVDSAASELQCSDNSDPEMVDSTASEPEILDQEVVSALTSTQSVETIVASETADPDDPAPVRTNESIDVPSNRVEVETTSSVESMEDTRSAGVSLSWEENQWFWDDEVISPGNTETMATNTGYIDSEILDEVATEDDVSGDNDCMEYVQEVTGGGSQSSSGIEELAMSDDNDAVGVREETENTQEDNGRTLPSIQSLRKNVKSNWTDSDSDFSDIVRIDHIPREPTPSTSAVTERRRYFRAADLMQVSASSSCSGSSGSSRFHFIHPLPGNHRYVYPKEDEEDVQSLPGDVDDRCESDISGVAPDDSDPDLSTISYDLDQLEIFEGNVVRSYKHRPNSTLNTLLTMMALLTLFTTIGIAIGHYLGTTREITLRSQQGVRIKEIQDEYLGCLRNQGMLKAQVSVTDEEKIAAVTAVWKQKFEELIIEKVDLEWTMRRLQQQMDDGLLEAQNKLILQRDEANLLVSDMNSLRNDEEEQLQLREKRLADSEAKLEKRKVFVAKQDARLVTKEAQLMNKMTAFDEQQTQLAELKGQLDKFEAGLDQNETALVETRGKLRDNAQELAARETVVSDREAQVVRKETELQMERAQLELDADDVRKETELQMERAQLELDADVVESARNKAEDPLLNTQEELRSRPPLSRQSNVDDGHVVGNQVISLQEWSSSSDLQSIQEQVNNLETENADLRRQVSILRYSAYQQTNEQLEVESKVNDELKQQANKLANENVDLKSIVGKLRYTEPTGNLNSEVVDEVDQETIDIPDNQRADDHLNHPNTEESSSNSEPIPTLWSYLKLLVPDVQNVISVEKLANLTKPLAMHIEFLKNATSDPKYTEALSQKWKELRNLVGHENTDKLNDKVHSIIGDLKNLFQNEYLKFQSYLDSKEFQEHREAVADKVNLVVDKINSSTMAEKYQEFVNKTKDSVSKLNHKIKKTWHKVKNLTGDFLMKNKALNAFGDKITKSMKDIGKKVESGWKKAHKHMVKKGLVPDSWNAKSEKAKGKKGKLWEKRLYNGKVPQQQHTTYDLNTHVNEPDNKNHIPDKREEFERRPEHKKKQSSNMEYEKYEEYWLQAEFEPDDFLQEGFFEGNNRQWHKHQKKARKLHGRLQRLNDDMFLAMDDDDIDDMYEDFEDLQDDVDDMEQPSEQLMTWLTCQIRWWKSRLYRKHSNEDLVKGCGRQLMQWQLGTLCRPCSSAMCEEKKRKNSVNQGTFCHYYQSVILPFIKQGQTGADSQKGCNKNPGSRKFISLSVDSDMENLDGHLHYSLQLDDEETPEAADQVNMTNFDSHEPSAKWIFERAEQRESYHHDGSWMFKRGAVRNFERNKPWYYERADERADLRTVQHQPKMRRRHQKREKYNKRGPK